MKKILVYGFGGLLALILFLVLGLWLFFPYDKARERLASEMSQALDTKVEIQELSFSLLPKVSVTLGGIEIGETPTPDLPKISVSELRVGVSLLPLLSKKIVVKEVLIDQPNVEMVLAETKERQESPEKAQGKIKVSYDFKLEKLVIRGMGLTIRQSNGKKLLKVENLSETLSASATTDGKIHLEGLLKVEKWRAFLPVGRVGRGLDIEFRKKISFDLTKDELTIDQASLKLGDLPLDLKGFVTNIRDEKKRAIDLAFEGGPANVKKIMGYIPLSLIPEEAKDVKSSGKVFVKGFARGVLAEKPDFSVDFSLENGKISAPILPASIEDIEVRLSATPKQVTLSQFSAKTVNSTLDMKATIENYDQKEPDVKGSIQAKINLSDIAVVNVLEKKEKLSGRIQLDATFDGKMAPGEDLTSAATGKVLFSNVAFKSPKLPVKVKSVNGSMQLDRGDFKMPGLKIALGESDITLKGYMKKATSLMDEEAKGAVKFDFTVASNRLNLDELIPATQEEDLETKEVVLPKPLERLVGEARLSVTSIRVNKLEARNAKGKVRLKRGVLNLDGLKLNAFGGTLGLKGVIDYKKPKKPKFDLGVNVDNVEVSEFFAYAENLNKLAGLGKFLKGRFSAQTTFDGSLKKDLSLNMGDLSSVGKLQMKGGEIAGHPIQSKLASFLDSPSLKKIPVKDWLAPFEIKDGKLEIKNLKMTAKNLGVAISGWQSIDGKTKLDMDVNLPKSAANGIKKHLPSSVADILLGGKDTNLLLPFEVGGKTTDPNISLKKGALTAQAKERTVEKLAAQRKKAETKLRSKATDTVGNLLGTKQDKTPKKKTGKKATKKAKKKKSTKKTVEDKAKNLVKDLF